MKDEWKRWASALRNDMMYDIVDPATKQMAFFSMKFRETQYESPKTYNNSYAFNDGSWLRFPTEYRGKKGKTKGIFLANKKKAVQELCYFCRFQKLIGVSLKEELVYHMARFLADVVKINGAAFDCNKENQELLYKIADRILMTDVEQSTLDRLKDPRKFCIDPDRLKMLSKETTATMQGKGRKMSNYFEIMKKYDENKSTRQNAELCGVSESTIKRFKRQRSQFVSMFK